MRLSIKDVERKFDMGEVPASTAIAWDAEKGCKVVIGALEDDMMVKLNEAGVELLGGPKRRTPKNDPEAVVADLVVNE